MRPKKRKVPVILASAQTDMFAAFDCLTILPARIADCRVINIQHQTEPIVPTASMHWRQYLRLWLAGDGDTWRDLNLFWLIDYDFSILSYIVSYRISHYNYYYITLDYFQMKFQGTMCRDTDISDCDLPEYCNGVNYFCPTDVYKRDGTNCTLDGVSLNICIKAIPHRRRGWWNERDDRLLSTVKPCFVHPFQMSFELLSPHYLPVIGTTYCEKKNHAG